MSKKNASIFKINNNIVCINGADENTPLIRERFAVARGVISALLGVALEEFVRVEPELHMKPDALGATVYENAGYIGPQYAGTLADAPDEWRQFSILGGKIIVHRWGKSAESKAHRDNANLRHSLMEEIWKGEPFRVALGERMAKAFGEQLNLLTEGKIDEARELSREKRQRAKFARWTYKNGQKAVQSSGADDATALASSIVLKGVDGKDINLADLEPGTLVVLATDGGTTFAPRTWDPSKSTSVTFFLGAQRKGLRIHKIA